MALEIFLFMLEIWSFQLKDESIKTPKYLMDSFSLIAFFIDFKGNTLFLWHIIWMKNYKIISFVDVE